MASLFEFARFVHIIAAAGWFGALLLLVGRIGPAIKAAGPAAGPFVVEVVRRGGIGTIIGPLGIFTVLAGLYMYIAGDFHKHPMSTGADMLLSLGALTGIIALGLGLAIAVPNEMKMKKIVAELQGPPTPEQGGQLRELGMKNAKLSGSIALLVSITILAMVGRTLV